MTSERPPLAPSRKSPPFKGWLRIAAFNLGVLAIGMIVVELIFGGWVFGENYGAMPILKNFRRQFDVQDLYGGEKTLFIRDSYGLRGHYDDPSKIDILTIGGSTTNELFITEGKTWSDVLARTFAEAGRPMTVVNAGVDGQSTIGHLKNFELWFPRIPHLRFRYGLVYVGINDLGNAMTGTVGKWDSLEDKRRPIKRYLMNNSALYTLFRNVRGMIRARNAKLIHGSETFNGTDWQEAVPQPDIAAAAKKYAADLAAYANRLRALAKRIRQWHAEPIFVTQHRADYRVRDGKVFGRPRADGTVDPGLYADIMAFNAVTMRVCRETGSICVDLAHELFFVDGDQYDALHSTPRGSAKIGRYLFDKLRNVIH